MDGREATAVAATSRFEYDSPVIRFGSGCVDRLEAELAERGLERALVVCGSTVGSTPAVIDPVKAGLGDRLAGVFAETTPNKRLETAADGTEAMAETAADVLVSLGGGSSLDTAKAVAVLAATDLSFEEAARELAESGTIAIPEGEGDGERRTDSDGEIPPVVAIPTTLAGADLSQVAGITLASENAPDDEPVGGGLSDPRLMPTAVFYDPELVATTPDRILAGSAMNGFDKGLETLYAPNRTPVTDATASRGLSLLREGLPGVVDSSSSGEAGTTDSIERTETADGSDSTVGTDTERAMDRAVEGTLLVQYGISRPDETTLSIVHAFGHGLRDHGNVQQGLAHAVVVPHVLEYLFERVDARRHLLADALGVPRDGRTEEEIAAGIVDEVAAVRDGLGLPTRLRELDGVEREEFPAIARTTLEDRFMENAPPGLEATAEDLERILERAW